MVSGYDDRWYGCVMRGMVGKVGKVSPYGGQSSRCHEGYGVHYTQLTSSPGF